MPAKSIERNLIKIKAQIEEACNRVGRCSSEITLIAISKGVPVESLQFAYNLGVRHFGENRLNEAIPKMAVLPQDVCWHFVGKLQTNKIKKICDYFQVIHSLDSVSQMEKLQTIGRKIPCFIEINIADEPQKSGIFPKDLDFFLELSLKYNQLSLYGLMTLGPKVSTQEETREYYRKMRFLLDKMPDKKMLSMGMSKDFEIAIEEGSTHIRVGTALFN